MLYCLFIYKSNAKKIKGLLLVITPSPPTKSVDFRGFDSSRLLILRGGNYHVR